VVLTGRTHSKKNQKVLLATKAKIQQNLRSEQPIDENTEQTSKRSRISGKEFKRTTSVKLSLKIAASAEHAVKMNFFGGNDNFRLSELPETSDSPQNSSFSNPHSMCCLSPEQQSSLPKESVQQPSREIRASMILCKSMCKYPPFRMLAKNKTALSAAAEFSENSCMTEVFGFLCAVVEYQDLCKNYTKEKQYCAFLKVAEHFIVPGSPSEINIASKMRENITKLMSESLFFVGLPSYEDRLDVFETVNREMERLFWLNLNLRKNTTDQTAQHLVSIIKKYQDFEAIHTTF